MYLSWRDNTCAWHLRNTWRDSNVRWHVYVAGISTWPQWSSIWKWPSLKCSGTPRRTQPTQKTRAPASATWKESALTTSVRKVSGRDKNRRSVHAMIFAAFLLKGNGTLTFFLSDGRYVRGASWGSRESTPLSHQALRLLPLQMVSTSMIKVLPIHLTMR